MQEVLGIFLTGLFTGGIIGATVMAVLTFDKDH